jgi:hypothetical protein
MSQTQAAQPAGTTIITLAHPITTPAGQVTSITMRRAKVRDLRRMADYGKDEAAQEIGLMAHLSGMTAEDFDELDAVDYRKLQETFRGFLGLTAA